MKSHKILLLGLCIALAAQFPVFSLDISPELDELFSSALAQDSQLRILNLAVESRELSIQRANLDKKLSLSAGTDKDGLVFIVPLTDTGSTSLTLDPFVAVTLPEDIETTIRLDADVDLGLADGTDFAFDPVISVSQPLNPILGIEKSERGRKLAESSSLIAARKAVWNREIGVKKAVIGKLKQVISYQKAVGEAERAVQSAEENLLLAKTIDTYNATSAEAIGLENALRAATRAQELATARSDLAAAEMADLVGGPVTEIPSNLGALEISPPSLDLDLHPAVQASRLAVEKAEIALAEHLEAYVPSYSVGASYTPAEDSHTVGASVNVGFENFSIGTSVSAGFGDLSGQSLVTGVSLRWSLPDNRAKNLITRELELGVESARLQHESTVNSVTMAVEAIKVQVMSLEMQQANLQERLKLEELVLKDTAKRFELGAVGENALRSAEWRFEKLNIDKMLLDYDVLGLLLDISALQYTE